MNGLRKIIRDIFGFSGNEINGFLILLPLITVVVCSEPLYRQWISARDVDWSEEHAFLDSLVASWPDPPVTSEVAFGDLDTLTRVSAFDPNTAPVPTMVASGVPVHLANRIAAYRQKGGHFRIKQDLLRIYGLDSALYRQLFLQIQLPSGREAPVAHRAGASRTTVLQEKERRFDINTADTVALKAVYGIGSRLAQRIVRFRDALGGFVNDHQLYEVYGLDSVVVDRLRKVSYIARDFTPKKLNINTANEEDLARHPYISRKMAQRITAYRFQHGAFPDTGAVRNVLVVSDDELERILPYIAAGN